MGKSTMKWLDVDPPIQRHPSYQLLHRRFGPLIEARQGGRRERRQDDPNYTSRCVRLCAQHQSQNLAVAHISTAGMIAQPALRPLTSVFLPASCSSQAFHNLRSSTAAAQFLRLLSDNSMAAPGTVTENFHPNLAAENGPVQKDVGSVGPASSVDPVKGKNLSKVANEIVPHVMDL
jgi:hypothetical protein